MFRRRHKLTPIEDRGPLRVMFVLTSMPVGGAETLLVEIIRRMDRGRFSPEVCCLKRLDALGETLAGEIPTHAGLLCHKWDLAVLPRLIKLLQQRRIDAVVSVGPGDKMFWGRLAARLAGVPVVCSALHSMGLPDHVEIPNRLLAPITDAFIAVARSHAVYLAEHEGCPPCKIRVISNGVDVEKFHPRWPARSLRAELGIPPGAATAGIIAALRPEKDHELFLRAAALVHRQLPEMHFLVVGDGPLREEIQLLAGRLSLEKVVHFLGTRSEIPEVLSLIDVVVLTSRMEANPISILEAMACEKPVVAPAVGTIPEMSGDGASGFLVQRRQPEAFAERVIELLGDGDRAAAMGREGRQQVIAHWSIDRTVEGYQELIAGIYAAKSSPPGKGESTPLGRRALSAR